MTAEKERKKNCWDATISEFSKLTSTKTFSKHTGCLNLFGKIPYLLDMLLLRFYCKTKLLYWYTIFLVMWQKLLAIFVSSQRLFVPWRNINTELLGYK